MDHFDKSIVLFFNEFSRKSWPFDHAVAFLSGNTFLKTWLITSSLIWYWFHPAKDSTEKRKLILATILSTIAALVFTKVLRLFLPFRARPLQDQELSFNLPYDVDSQTLYEWSSFPSDHAAMFFALSAGLFYISKRIGAIALIYSLVMVCLPRVYLGFHYPTDIITGAAIGLVIGSIGGLPKIRKYIAYYPIILMRFNPGIFYVFLFFLFIEITNVFEDVRAILGFIASFTDS